MRPEAAPAKDLGSWLLVLKLLQWLLPLSLTLQDTTPASSSPVENSGVAGTTATAETRSWGEVPRGVDDCGGELAVAVAGAPGVTGAFAEAAPAML